MKFSKAVPDLGYPQNDVAQASTQIIHASGYHLESLGQWIRLHVKTILTVVPGVVPIFWEVRKVWRVPETRHRNEGSRGPMHLATSATFQQHGPQTLRAWFTNGRVKTARTTSDQR